MHIANLFFSAALGAVAFCMTVPAQAQDASADGRIRYSADFFAHVQPNNALDMISLLPGFRLVEGDNALRGYSGASGNVLVDGQRPAGKAETLEDVLKRIPAARVDHIELLRAGASGVDMQGYPLLANVVLRAAGRLGGRVEAEQAYFRHGYSAPRAAAQLDIDRGGHVLNLSAAAYRDVDDEHGFGSRHRLAADGSAVRLADYFQPEVERVLEGTIVYRRPLFNGTLRLNGLAKDVRKNVDIGYDIYVPTHEMIRGSERKHEQVYELGLRYERSLGTASDLDLIASYRSEQEIGLDSETSVGEESLSDERARASEAILRVALRHRRAPFSIEIGAEGAINRLKSKNLLFEDDVAIPLPNADVRVEERRAEFFANVAWDVAPTWSLESGLRYEISRLEQHGDSDMAKSLAFVKPRARLNWSPSPQHQLRLLIERDVGQLDFGNFVGAASLNAGTISAGNRDLEPDSLWRAEAAYELRLGKGSLLLTARREWISDLVDQLPIEVDGQIYDAVGNIGKARRDQIDAALKWPLDGLGLTGVMLDAQIIARRSRVTDPSTGLKRPISKDTPREAKIWLTHDIAAWHIRWGGSLAFARHKTSYKVSDIQTDALGERLDIFVEYKPNSRWTMRLFGRNLTDSPSVRTREIYRGVRGSSDFRYYDIRNLRSGPYVGLNVQHRFGG